MQAILFEKRGHVAWVTFNRPELLNAINRTVLDELGETLTRVDADGDVRVAVFASRGKAFITGADVSAA